MDPDIPYLDTPRGRSDKITEISKPNNRTFAPWQGDFPADTISEAQPGVLTKPTLSPTPVMFYTDPIGLKTDANNQSSSKWQGDW